MRKYQKGNSAPTFSNSISSVSFDIYCRRIHGIEIPILFSPNFNSETWLLTYHWENRQENDKSLTLVDRIEKIDLYCFLKSPRNTKLSIYVEIAIELKFVAYLINCKLSQICCIMTQMLEFFDNWAQDLLYYVAKVAILG